MIDILLLTVPIYLVVAVGFVSVRTHYITHDHIIILGQFVLKVCLPALVFAAVTQAGDGGLNFGFMFAYLVASLIILVSGAWLSHRVLAKSRDLSWILGLGMANSNSGYFGFPIAALVFGGGAAQVLAWVMIVENLFIIPLAMTAADIAAGEKGSLGSTFSRMGRSLATNPLFVAIVLGLLMRSSGVHIPLPMDRGLSMLAAVAPGAALVVVGGTVAHYPLGGQFKAAPVVATIKLVLHPLAVFAALSLVPGLSPEL
ncbi:MAG TPA: AEC family transporter, partial [Paracoccaceae bacterium]|nr:AEC family transporter [Paracoccaceae bacterium]